MSSTPDVVVVGAGPTGLTVALSLIARGREVTVIDSLPEGSKTSRASVRYSRTLELLEPYGVAAQLVAQGYPRAAVHDSRPGQATHDCSL